MSADRCTCASHGPWVAIRDRRRMCPWRVEAEDGRAYVADIPQPTRDPYPIFEANAQHIATFDPPTVLSLLSRLREAEEALRLASGVVDSQVSTERYLERQAIQAGHYTPDPNDTHKSAAVKAQDAILASLRYDPTEREDEGLQRHLGGDGIGAAATGSEPSGWGATATGYALHSGERMAHLLKLRLARGESITPDDLDRLAELVDAPRPVATADDLQWAHRMAREHAAQSLPADPEGSK
jgi:hypothetical protein